MLSAQLLSEQTRSEWWSKKRERYNRGLVIAGIIAFIAYASVIVIKSAHDIHNTDPEKYEITLFTTLFQGIGYLIMIGIANLFFNLDLVVDKLFNKENSQRFRENLFKTGFWFSCALPFSIPLLVCIVL